MIDKTVEVAAIKPDEATADGGLEEADGELDITIKGDELNKPLPEVLSHNPDLGCCGIIFHYAIILY